MGREEDLHFHKGTIKKRMGREVQVSVSQSSEGVCKEGEWCYRPENPWIGERRRQKMGKEGNLRIAPTFHCRERGKRKE